MKRSPLAPAGFPALAPIDGVRLAVAQTGTKYKDRDDLLLLLFDKQTSFAGVFTTSATASAPVLLSKEVAKKGAIAAILVNAGNANAFTGALGTQTVNTCIKALADCFDLPEDQIATASTGVIGEPLDPQSLTRHFEALKTMPPADWQQAAGAILTTDTFAKGATKTVTIGDDVFHLSAIAKGSGMIAPDMATMLSFIVTDAGIEAPVLAEMLSRQTKTSFNAITVDSDTSTSDSVYLAATGKAGRLEGKQAQDIFEQALGEVMRDLAMQIVRDGEGASKFITIDVTGAVSDESAHKIGLAIGNSPLVKTAIAGEDANWGRIVMAVGKAGEPADRDKLAIAIGGVTITHNGQRCDDYDEAPVAAHMKGDEIFISVDIGLGTGRARIWTCDFTHGYITINADYRS
ncbi:MAG: bifunctional glutamate N-acetyltransferase/amino-acid acetyltransferase ArgJ [Candidatus Puniceispirillaceae bacterium]